MWNIECCLYSQTIDLVVRHVKKCFGCRCVVKHTGNRAACHCRMLAIDSDNIADDVIDFI